MLPNKAAVEGVGDAMQLAEVKGRSLWADARTRFFRNKAAVVSLIMLGCVGAFAFFGGGRAEN